MHTTHSDADRVEESARSAVWALQPTCADPASPICTMTVCKDTGAAFQDGTLPERKRAVQTSSKNCWGFEASPHSRLVPLIRPASIPDALGSCGVGLHGGLESRDSFGFLRGQWYRVNVARQICWILYASRNHKKLWCCMLVASGLSGRSFKQKNLSCGC